MLKILSHDTKRPIFSGHETFPLRYGWLKKSYDAIINSESDAKAVFSADEAIAEFGVGKNMVSSMRYWCNMTGMIKDGRLDSIAKSILDNDGFDPWMEQPMTLWILHYHLCTNVQLLTYYWFFNINNHVNLDRKTFLNEMLEYCAKEGIKLPSTTTLKRDIECFIRLYMFKANNSNDDAIESPLTELALIVPLHKQGYFAGNRGVKNNLPAPLFWQAVFIFWQEQFNTQKTLSLSSLAYAPLSPGRVFLLDENSLINMIYQSVNIFDGKVEWSETAGLRQLELKGNISLEALIEICHAKVEGLYKNEI